MNDHPEIEFEDLDYGAYALTYENGQFTENFKYTSADFTKLYLRKIKLPEGKSNIVYLLSTSFEKSLDMVTRNIFIRPPTYRRIFYPWILTGSFMGRRYRVNSIGKKSARNKLISETTNLKPITTRTLGSSIENVFFSVSDIHRAVEPIMQAYPIKKNYENFFKEFISIIKGITPDPVAVDDKRGSGKRILIIDTEAFGFENGASLKENKTNPLFLLYLAYLRTRDLTNMGVDMDMLICAGNMFMKFNPAKLTRDKLQVFKRALFRMMNTNLDDYTSSLSDDEKNELEITSSEKIVSNIISNVISPYTKNVSPATQSTLATSVEKTFRKQVADVSKADAEIKKALSTTATASTKNTAPERNIFNNNLPQQQNFTKPAILSVNPRPKSLIHTNPAVRPLTAAQEMMFRQLSGTYTPLLFKTNLMADDDDGDDDDDTDYNDDEYISMYSDDEEEGSIDDVEEEIENDTSEILTTSEEVAAEVMEDIQDRTVPLNNPKTAPLNGALDKKLREQQKRVMVKNSSIEEIMSIETDNVPIQETNKSKVMHTSNENMKNIKFANFNKTYLDELYSKDIVACFDQFKDKSNPFYITGIDIKDTSDTMNLVETWSVHLIDETKKKYTVNVDIPKFYDDKFMLIDGTKYIINPQNFYNPLVKDTPGEVILSTNYNKITIKRKSTKSLSTVERIFSLMKKTDGIFVVGDSSKSNMKYVSSLEYDEISAKIFKYSSKRCTLYFSRDYIKEHLSDKIPSDIKGNEFFIGTENGVPVLINEDTGLDRLGRTIAEIIEANLGEEERAIYTSIKSPKQSMFAEGKLAGQYIPIMVILITWVGLTNVLDQMDIRWKFNPDIKRLPPDTPTSRHIRFADGVLEYEAKTYAELLLNGINKLQPEKLPFSAFDTEESYADYIYSVWGSYKGISEVKRFYEFLIDPITKNVCRTLKLPDDPVGLMIYAVKMLCSNEYVNKASDTSYRVRTIEIIPAILNECITKQYQAHVNSGRRLPMTLNSRCVIKKLVDGSVPNVEAYSTLNPVVEVAKMHNVTPKGYRGSNSDHAYRDESKRSYDPSSIGKLAITTSADAKVGINRQLSVEPTIANARGFREQVEDIEELKDVNIFSPVELLTPGTARNDDPIRTAIAAKQSQHVVPVKDAQPALISNGYDEAVQFHLSSDFVINADEDGEVIDVNDKLGFIMVRYKSGKTRAINTNPEIVKNSGGGFFMSNTLTPTHTKVGEKFKKDEPLAYHSKYFTYSEMNGLRYAIGPIVKMAIMSSYNTYEDAGICTESLAERMETNIVYQQNGRFKKNNNILSMVKIGDHVNIGDPLIRFDVSVEENEIAKYLSKLSEENAAIIEEETKNDIKADHAGKVIDIKVYTLLDPENLSPSLAKIVKQYFNKGMDKKRYLNKFDNSEGIIKSGYLLTDTTEPIKNRYNIIKGNKGIDVLIEIYIEHSDVMGVGDKVALYGPNKQIISETIPKGLEPYSELHPDEEISVMTSPGTIARRMTPSIIPISAAMKDMIELKRKIKSDIKISGTTVTNRRDIEKLIYDVFDALDPSGANTMKYKNMFTPMSDGQFCKFFKGFLANDKENFILDIVEFERNLEMKNCEAAAKVLGIPLMEYVYMPHLSMDRKHVVVSKEKCLVGYIPVKRTQQLLHKKNGLSVSNEKVSALTGQVVQKDKNSRDSDIEASLLVSLGADKILQELHGPRADDHVMKRQMNQSIATKGYVMLDELDNLSTNKVTLNTVNTYLITMGLMSDLISDTYILPKTSDDLFG